MPTPPTVATRLPRQSNGPVAGDVVHAAAYTDIERATDLPFYFANPHHAWERGTNENTNGLIRQYLPKNTSLARLTPAQCVDIEKSLNSRPRKRHGYKTPDEIIHSER
jgi:transposase, IS30 family